MPHISQLTYAIGDIHGHDELFERLIDRIRFDAEFARLRPRLVLLGDYIDRGPQSRQVLDRIIRLEASNWCDLVVLKGNHEDAMLRFLNEPEFGGTWRDWGGAATLANYGVDLPYRTDEAAWHQARDAFATAVDPRHVDLLKRMPTFYQADGYMFVHAGVHPDKPLSEQGPETFMYIRGPFLRAEKACNFVVVHGHTPENDPADTPWRIGVDTGVYFNGVLTAVRLHGDERAFVQAR